MDATIIAIVVLYLFSHLFSLLGYVNDLNNMFLTPRKIYYKLDCINWFGAIFIYIIYFCVVPLYAVIAFMMWLCTVRRK